MENIFLDHICSSTPYVSAHFEEDRKKVRLNQNESLLPFPQQLLQQSLKEIGRHAHLYPDPDCREVRELYAAIYELDPARIIVTNGSNNALEIVARATLSENSEVIINAPTYDVMRMEAGLQKANIIMAYPEDPFADDIDHLLEKVSNKSRLIYIANPNNPSGNLYSRENIIALLDTGKLVVLDEAYVDFAPFDCLDLVNQYQNLIIIRTLSKAFSAAGLRIGFIISAEPNINILKKISPPWNVNLFAQELTKQILLNFDLFRNNTEELIAVKEKFYTDLDLLPVTYKRSATNFVMVKFSNPREIITRLHERDILVSDKSKLHGMDGYVRITIGTAEVMDNLVVNLKNILFPTTATISTIHQSTVSRRAM